MVILRATLAAAVVISVVLGVSPASTRAGGRAAQATSVSTNRAVAFLSREVPRWRREHPCYSCHNNGDATRALIAASRYREVGPAIGDTVAWLATPDKWEANAQGGGIEDKPLARVQFASALAAAVDRGLAPQTALVSAARQVAADQHEDGSWRLDSSQSLGSPATYGTALATATARRTLARAGAPEHREALARADRWLRRVEAATVLDAAAVAFGLDRAEDADARAQRQRCLDVLKRGQGPNGGWGPYVTAAAEPFDTALALIALVPLADRPALASSVYAVPDLERAIARGREYLMREQRADGSWAETTRPALQESYAQRISTTGWATLALLAAQ